MNTDARAMLERGYKIHPLAPGQKYPSVQWQNDEIFTVDEDQNYGINCGKSGLVVVDIDGPEGIEQFEQILGDQPYPNTFAVSTPRGGMHLYFKGTGYHNSAKQVAPSIDIRGDGGQVVGPGSTINGKTYEIENDVEPLELPDWLKPRLNPNFTPVEALWAVEQQRRAPVNGHDDYLKSQVFIYRLKQLDEDQAYELWQQEVDQLDTDSSDPFTRADFERHWKGADRKITKQEVAQTEEVKRAVGLFAYQNFDDLDTTPLTFRIPELLPTDSTVLFSAQYKAGKTSSTINLVNAFTSHDDFFGEFPVSTVTGNVVYVNLELSEQMFHHYCEQAGFEAGRKHLKILNLRGQASKMQILKDVFVESWAEELKKMDTEVLIIDPLSAIMVANNYAENDTMARLILEKFGSVKQIAGIDHLIVVDHTGHQNTGRSRGASSKMDWPDVLWNQEKNGSEHTRKFSAFGRGDIEKTFTISKNPVTHRIETTVPVDADGGDARMILGTIENKPGILFWPLQEKTQIAESTLRRRLKEYESDGKIHTTPIPGSKAKGFYRTIENASGV